MTIYVDVLWINLFICFIWVIRLTNVFLQARLAIKRVLLATGVGATVECGEIIIGICQGLGEYRWWGILSMTISIASVGLLIKGRNKRKLRYYIMVLGIASILLAGGIFAVSEACGMNASHMGSLLFLMLITIVGMGEELLLRVFCRHIWNRKLSYGVIINLKGKNYFLKGFCDTGNFLRDKRKKGVWILAEERFCQLAGWNPGSTSAVAFTDASGISRSMEAMRIEKIWLTGNGGEIDEFQNVTIAKGGRSFGGRYDVLLPYDVVWKKE